MQCALLSSLFCGMFFNKYVFKHVLGYLVSNIKLMNYQFSKNMLKTLQFLLHWLFPEYEQRTLYGALVVILAMLLRLINFRFIIIIIIY